MKGVLVLPPALERPSLVGVAVSHFPGARPVTRSFLSSQQFSCISLRRVSFLQRDGAGAVLGQIHLQRAQEDAHFDSDVGEFTAVTELGRPDAESWNQQKDFMEQMRAKVDTVCRSSYWGIGSFTRQRRVAPTVTVYPAKTQPLQHHNLLVCSVNGFYPGHIEVRWFRNGQEEEAGVVSTGLILNGDWTFQTMVMLETVPQSGEVYTCHVEHPSRTSPITSECAQSKILSGTGGFVLGLLFLGVGLFIYFRNQKVDLKFPGNPEIDSPWLAVVET
eukprot:bmy_03102T0